MRNQVLYSNQIALNPPGARLAKVIEMNWHNWVVPNKEHRMPKTRKEEIGRISTPVNPQVARQPYLPVRMNSNQISRLQEIENGMVVYNIDEQTCQRFTGTMWQSISHYPGERHSGGIVLEVNGDGATGLITTISGQNTTVQWKDAYHSIELRELTSIPDIISQQWDPTILRGNHTTYAIRMASHYCVTANGQMVRGWRIPVLSELLLMLQDNLLGSSFKTGTAWAFQESDKISWLHLTPGTSQEIHSSTDQYFVRLVRPF
ncbi:MAG: hypothetical protein ACKOOA_05065 [Sediminibacterium sp.]